MLYWSDTTGHSTCRRLPLHPPHDQTLSQLLQMNLLLQRQPQSLQSFIAYWFVSKATKPENWVTSWGSSGLTLLRIWVMIQAHTHSHTHMTPYWGLKQIDLWEMEGAGTYITNTFPGIHTHSLDISTCLADSFTHKTISSTTAHKKERHHFSS